MSDCVWPHRQQPTRLPRPWDSPGKNTGVGCHFLLQCVKVKSESEVAQSCPTLSRQLFPNGWETPSSSWSRLGWGSRGHPHTWSCRSPAAAPSEAQLPTSTESLALSLQYIECTGPGGSGTSPTRWSPGPGLEPEMHGSAQCTGALATWTAGCLCNSRHCTRTWGPPSFGYFPSVDTSPWNPLPPAPRAAAAPPWQPAQFLAAPAPTWTPVHRLDLLICNFYFFFFFLTWLF